MASDLIRPRRALLSVSDKTGLEPFARALVELGVELLSTGGTHKLLHAAGLPVREVAEHTGHPEMMDGRVKTLHPKVHGGILGREDGSGGGLDAAVMAEHKIAPIDLVVVNLYPFAATVARGAALPEVIENIDIGGPAMVRSAAKNHSRVAVVVDPGDYPRLLAELAANDGAMAQATRFQLASKAFRHTAAYDGAIANHLASLDPAAPELPAAAYGDSLSLQFTKTLDLRYGENPHQAAAFYRETGGDHRGTVAGAEQLHGKALSFNNINDTEAALETVRLFDQPACVIVKHANPCGVAVADDIQTAYDLAFATDETSAFGGIIAFNRPLDADTAAAIVARQFVEVIIAPAVLDGALAAVQAKKNVRLLVCGELAASAPAGRDYKRVRGGLLVQDVDGQLLGPDGLQVVSRRRPTEQELADLAFAWKVALMVKSNAIVYARDGRTLGVGAGQMSRVVSARIASMKATDAGLVVPGSVMASDAFFPFRDGIDAAADAGIAAVIQPGGSMRDAEVIAAADDHGMAMVFTGARHFRH